MENKKLKNLGGRHSILTDGEVNQIERYGIMTKPLFSYNTYIGSVLTKILPFFLITAIMVYLGGMNNLQYIGVQGFVIGSTEILSISWAIILSIFTYFYFRYKHILILSEGRIVLVNNIYKKIDDIPTRFLPLIHTHTTLSDIFNGVSFLFWPILCIYTTVGVILSLPFIMVGYIIDFFNPISRFVRLGSKVQSLTIEILHTTDMMQKNYNSFTDIRVRFEKLSQVFSGVITTIIQLEKTEKIVNKGDLFDSKKYIDAIRNDIHTPLVNLREFLKQKRCELVESIKESSPVQVKVGGISEQENLQLIRSNELLKELESNIARLDEMIGKL